ncbi:MAG: alpha-amylase [Sphingobacteriales bacterium]|nr:alpha-amylase [Sphingobacteriales bacterium]
MKYATISFLFWVGFSVFAIPALQAQTLPVPFKPCEQLLSALQLQAPNDSTHLLLSDYLCEPYTISSIQTHSSIVYHLSDDRKQLSFWIKDKEALPPLSWLTIRGNGKNTSILVKKSDKQKVLFSYQPEKANRPMKVQLAGDMNQWNPANTTLVWNEAQQQYETEMYLKSGIYAYQIVADGKWQLDPANSEQMPNGMGGFNSKRTIGDPLQRKVPHLTTFKYTDTHILIKGERDPYKMVAQWQNTAIDAFYSEGSQTYQILIPQEAKLLPRSFVRVQAYNEHGISNELLLPLHFGRVLDKVQEIQRSDAQAQIIYNVFIDRFYNGNPTNDRPTPDPEILPKANYYGGDIAGITQQLNKGFFDELGINTLWISPVVKNPKGAWGLFNKDGVRTKFSAYHGYWPVSFNQVEERLGTAQDLKNLVAAAHDHNDNVLLDFVAHHVHQEHPFYQQNPTLVTNLHLPDGSLNTERWDDHRLTTWFDVFLPTLDFSNAKVRQMLSDSAVFWLKEYQLDGFRHDATKHIPEIFWRDLTKKIKKEIQHPIYQIGETYGSPELIGSYLGSGMLDAQFDFNVYDGLVGALVNKNASFDDLKSRIIQSCTTYGYHHTMGNISGNQDRPRFMALASGKLSFEDDAKWVGWAKNIQTEAADSAAFKKMALLQACIFTLNGIPIVYYGDEIGMTGGNDPDNRRPMQFENYTPEQKKLRHTVQQLAKLRRNTLPLLYGDLRLLNSSDADVLVYSRNYFGKSALILINKSEHDSKALTLQVPDFFNTEKLESNFGQAAKVQHKFISITLPPLSFEIMTTP